MPTNEKRTPRPSSGTTSRPRRVTDDTAGTTSGTVYEVLLRRPDGHETAHRVDAGSESAARKAVTDRLRPGEAEVVDVRAV